MAASAYTVTVPNPTPPTNMSFSGATPPNPPNYTKNTYIDWLPDTDSDTYPPPFLECDASTAGSLVVFAAATAGLSSRLRRHRRRHRGQLPGCCVRHGAGEHVSVSPEGAGTRDGGHRPRQHRPHLSGRGDGAPPASRSPVWAATRSTPNISHASSMSPTTNPALEPRSRRPPRRLPRAARRPSPARAPTSFRAAASGSTTRSGTPPGSARRR